MRFTVRTPGPDPRPGPRWPAISGRLAGTAVAALALTTASLLAAGSPARAASVGGVTSPGRAAPVAATMSLSARAGQAAIARRPFTTPTGLELGSTPAVWNGTDLVTTQADLDGNLHAYEQVPGASSWKKAVIATAAGNGGAKYGSPWITATATSVQVVSEDANGNIWFFQQLDGKTKWSAPEHVGTVSLSNLAGFQLPKIAWTGVPGHTGTNSVITIMDGSGDVLFWYQSGSSWIEQTVATGTEDNPYYTPAITATDKGIVIVAFAYNGAVYTWYQPYGGSGWNSDGTVGAPSGEQFEYVSATWDGTHVAVAAAFDTGDDPGGFGPDELLLLTKTDSAQFWSEEKILTTPDSQRLSGYTDIAWTGFNLVMAAVQIQSPTTERLDFWWQGSTFTNFNFESAATVKSPQQLFAATLLADGNSSGEGAIFAQSYAANDFTHVGLFDWTQPVGQSGWTKHTVSPS